MENKELKKKVSVSVEDGETAIVVVINKQAYVGRSSMGPGRCKDCELNVKRGKECIMSLVCANLLNGGIFKRKQSGQAERTSKPQERKPVEAARGLAGYYEKSGYQGD